MTTITENEVARLTKRVAILEAERDQLAAECAQLREGIANKQRNAQATEIIERAKAMLMHQYGWSEQKAFKTIQRAAMDKRIPVPEEAQRIINSPLLEMAQEKPHERRLRSGHRVPPHR